MTPAEMPLRALVTGAARGIGAAIAERLRADGLQVETLDRDEGCDLRVDLTTDELPDLSGIDVLVSNAAITDTIASAHRMTPEQWQRDMKDDDIQATLDADEKITAERRLPAEPAVVVGGANGTEQLIQSPSLADVQAAIAKVS